MVIVGLFDRIIYFIIVRFHQSGYICRIVRFKWAELYTTRVGKHNTKVDYGQILFYPLRALLTTLKSENYSNNIELKKKNNK